MKQVIVFALVVLSCRLGAQPVSFIPQPVMLQWKAGSFMLDNQTSIKISETNKELIAAAKLLSGCIEKISGLKLPVNATSKKSIELKIAVTEGIGNEGYLLDINPSFIRITANKKEGIVCGIQTLLQALPAIRTNAALEISSLEIKDYPRFTWRGMHLDVSRHFFSPELVKLYIDMLAMYKMNIFHWHLTDDQGWRIEIKKYPKLTQVGAWRVDHTDQVWGFRPQAKPGEKPTYGGYYTQQQIKEIVQYATERNITIVPEIEMPGHSAAAIASYPFLSCSQQPQLPLTGGNYTNMSSNFCAGNDSVFAFLQDVLSEVIELFPSKYIHIGGDEVDKTDWKHCAKCQKRIKGEGLKNEEELQSYFIKRMEKFITSKHRKLLGWDEILEGGLAPEATVMSWRGEAGGIAAAKMDHDVVMTPANPVYFDHYQGDPVTEPLANGGFNTLKRVYNYEPVPEVLNGEQAKHILGAQANLWTELITTPDRALYMILPRMIALSEVVWSAKEARDWPGFNERLQYHFKRIDQMRLPYSKGNFKVDIKPVTKDGKLLVELSSELYDSEIFYTTDGSEPTLQSEKYVQAFIINGSSVVKAVVAVKGVVMNKQASQQTFTMHKAVGRNVHYTYPESRYYQADGPNTLADGIRGTESHTKYWHGFNDHDLIATIDLGAAIEVNRISLGCLQRVRDWILMPEWVKFEASANGTDFTELGIVKNKIPASNNTATIQDFTLPIAAAKLRYIRVTAKLQKALPPDHPAAGGQPWLFADEIVVE